MFLINRLMLGRCPKCQKGAIFAGFLTVKPHCETCGLSLAAHENGDGASFFGIVVMGTLTVIGAAVVEILYMPPYWVHAAIWPVFIVVGSLICLRFAKAGLICLQYTLRPQDFDDGQHLI